jgi:HSP90 family molecular chaperone
MGQEAPPEHKILELNASHPLVRKMAGREGQDLKDCAVLLAGLASISDGEPLTDAAAFTETLGKLLGE